MLIWLEKCVWINGNMKRNMNILLHQVCVVLYNCPTSIAHRLCKKNIIVLQQKFWVLSSAIRVVVSRGQNCHSIFTEHQFSTLQRSHGGKENWEGFCTQKSKLTFICNEERIHWKPLCKFMLEEVIMTNVFKTWNNTGNHTHSMSQPSIMKGTFTRKKWGVRTKLRNNSITLFGILEVTFAAGDFSDLKASQVCLLRGKKKLKYAECGEKAFNKMFARVV